MENKKRLIDAHEAKAKLRSVHEWFDGPPQTDQDKLAQAVVKMCVEEVDKLKPVDAVEVVHGRWDGKEGLYQGKCSVCGYMTYDRTADWARSYWHYCPNCGAKMDGERKDNE